MFEPREAETERVTDGSIWLQLLSSSPSPTNGGCIDPPMVHESQVLLILTPNLKFCLFLLRFGCETS